MIKKILASLVSQSITLYHRVSIRHRAQWAYRSFSLPAGSAELTPAQKQAVRDFYAPYRKKIPRYFRKHFDFFPAFFTNATGEFHAETIPTSLYYCFVDPYFNDWKAADYLDNKCLYARLFPDALQPETAAMRCNGFWQADGQLMSEEQLLEHLAAVPEVVVKVAQGSCGGHGVYFCEGSDSEKLKSLFAEIREDLVLQKPLTQHPALARIHPGSVNTIRILTLLRGDDVKIYSAVLRMGAGGSRVDNASSGGMTCGIRADGSLKDCAFTLKGERFDRHPTSGLPFSEITVPAFRECCELVKRLHPTLPWFRLVSWDLTVNEQEQPVLIEANMCFGGPNVHQLSNGPIFGEDTKAILDEVFGIQGS